MNEVMLEQEPGTRTWKRAGAGRNFALKREKCGNSRGKMIESAQVSHFVSGFWEGSFPRTAIYRLVSSPATPPPLISITDPFQLIQSVNSILMSQSEPICGHIQFPRAAIYRLVSSPPPASPASPASLLPFESITDRF